MADKNFEVRKGLTVANTVIVTSGANVGINNTSPTHTLSVNGTGFVNTSLQVSTTVTANATVLYTSANLSFDGALIVDGTPGTTNDLLISNGSSGAYWGSLVSSGLIPSEYVREDENTTFTGNNIFSGANTSFTGANVSFTGANLIVSGTNLNVSSNASFTGNLSVSRITSSQNVTTLGTTLYITTTGNVGISNSAPTHKFRVNGTSSLAGEVSDITTLSAGNTTITGFVNSSVSVNSALITVGSSVISNTSGVYTTGTMNAASHTVGTSTIANSTGVYTTGTINAQSYTVGTSFVANSTVVNAFAYNIGTAFIANTLGVYHIGTVNAQLFSVGTSTLANSTGVYTTGTMNAASYTIGTSFVANSTGVNASSYTIGTDFVANSTGVYTGVVNGSTLSVGTSVTANSTRVVLGTSVGLQANGGVGTSGQVLHSNGTTVYWATDDEGVTSVATGNGLTGGTITSTGTVSVLANTGIIANATGTYVNSAYIATIASNSATYANASISNTFTVGTSTYFVANGNVGVGTSSPTSTLDVSGTVSIAKANVQSQTLTDQATIAWDTSLGQIATVTLQGNRTFGAPTNLKIGTYVLNIVQDGVGGRTGDFTNAIFKFPGGVDPVLTTTANARDIIFFYSDGTNLYGSFLPDVK